MVLTYKISKIYTNEYGTTILLVLTIENGMDYKSLVFSVNRYRALDNDNLELGWKEIGTKNFTFADISALVQLYKQSSEIQKELTAPF